MEFIWIDALEFDHYGGFMKDTQFVGEMGQGYLLADGVGQPVAPAVTKFTIRENGYHRFHIRTKNWCVGFDPDGLQIAVDDVLSPHISGIMQISGWYFEVAADFDLCAGEHELKVYDTTGWCGRFADIIITNDYDFTPAPEVKKMKSQRAKIKGICAAVTEHGGYDLVVAGSGAAAVAAAIAAARNGSKVALLSGRPVLGGNGSDESKVSYDGAATQGFHETGIIYQIKCYMLAKQVSWSRAFLHFVRQEKNIDLFLDMYVIDACTENNVIRSVLAQHTIDMTEHRFCGDYYVDGTGDGWIGYYADARYRIGREASFQHNESFAPEVADGNTMSGCATRAIDAINDTICCYYAEETDHEVAYCAPAWAFKLPEGDELGRTPPWLERGTWWLENRNDYDDLWEAEYVRDAFIRITAGYFDWMKNSWKEKARAKNYKLSLLSTYVAKRESRRLIGDYIMTQNDYAENTVFEDEVCYTGWRMDVHHVKGIFSGKAGEFTVNQKVPLTPVPFRCLYSKNIENLMMAGRCISVTHMALGSTRTQLTTATMGQAVGTAAALCKKYSMTPRQLGKTKIKELQQILLRDDQTLLYTKNEDPDDLARIAAISADSFADYGAPESVISGTSRQMKDEPYAWISKQALPQSITLQWDTEQTIRQVIVTAEMPLADHPFGYKPAPSPDKMVTDLQVEALINGSWETVGQVADNFYRQIVVDMQPQRTRALKVTVLKAYNYDKAIIPEIRVY